MGNYAGKQTFLRTLDGRKGYLVNALQNFIREIKLNLHDDPSTYTDYKSGTNVSGVKIWMDI